MDGAKELPEDLMIQVLLKLPVRCLVRFRCVSKFWNNLIRSPNFVRMHLNRVDRDEIVLVKGYPRYTDKLSLHSYQSLGTITPNLEAHFEFSSDIWIVGSCNGLICMKSDKEFYYLWNPALMQFKIVPERPFVLRFINGKICILGMGLGYDSVTDDYKVVSVGCIKGFNEFDDNRFCIYKVAVYYLSTGCWREFDVVIPEIEYLPFEYCNLFINGACHWFALEKAGLGTVTKRRILAFNFIDEVFRTIELPDALTDIKTKIDNILVLHQMLTFVLCSRQKPGDNSIEDPGSSYVEVWVMKEYGVKESWVRQYVVGPVRAWYPLSFWKNNQLLFQHWDWQLVSCALDAAEENQEFVISAVLLHMQVVTYQESLFSLGE